MIIKFFEVLEEKYSESVQKKFINQKERLDQASELFKEIEQETVRLLSEKPKNPSPNLNYDLWKNLE